MLMLPTQWLNKEFTKQLALAAHSIQYTGKASQQASKLATNNLQFSNNM